MILICCIPTTSKLQRGELKVALRFSHFEIQHAAPGYPVQNLSEVYRAGWSPGPLSNWGAFPLHTTHLTALDQAHILLSYWDFPESAVGWWSPGLGQAAEGVLGKAFWDMHTAAAGRREGTEEKWHALLGRHSWTFATPRCTCSCCPNCLFWMPTITSDLGFHQSIQTSVKRTYKTDI